MFDYDENGESRVSYEIIYRILNHIENKGRSLKTRILYASNLNSKSLEKYLRFLMKKNLILETCDNRGRKYYVLTPDGREFLYRLRKIIESTNNHFSRKLMEFIRNEYLMKQPSENTRKSNRKRLHIVVVNNNSTIKEALSEILLSYVNARIDDEEVLALIPSGLHYKVLEFLGDIRSLYGLRLYAYNEREDFRNLTYKIINMLRNLETQYILSI